MTFISKGFLQFRLDLQFLNKPLDSIFCAFTIKSFRAQKCNFYNAIVMDGVIPVIMILNANVRILSKSN